MLTEKSLAELPKRGVSVYESTDRYYSGELDEGQLTALLTAVAASHDLDGDGRTCILLGLGGQPKSVYERLKSADGLRIVWDGPFMPIPFYPLLLIAAAHGGLVLVEDRAALADAVIALSEQAILELYSARLRPLAKIKRCFKWDGLLCRHRTGRLIAADPAYFCLGAEYGSHDAPEGYCVWCSFGPDCPDSLRDVIQPFLATAGLGETGGEDTAAGDNPA